MFHIVDIRLSRVDFRIQLRATVSKVGRYAFIKVLPISSRNPIFFILIF